MYDIRTAKGKKSGMEFINIKDILVLLALLNDFAHSQDELARLLAKELTSFLNKDAPKKLINEEVITKTG